MSSYDRPGRLNQVVSKEDFRIRMYSSGLSFCRTVSRIAFRFLTRCFRLAWRACGKLQSGWRRNYADYMAARVKPGQRLIRECRRTCKVLKASFPQKASPFFLLRHCLGYIFCTSFLGATPVSDYIGNELFRYGWGFRRRVMTSGKRSFVSKSLNSHEAWALCKDKPASAEWWAEWYHREHLTVGPGHPVTADQIQTLLKGKQRLILKPTNKACGRGIRMLDLRDMDEIRRAADELNRLETPHILEECLEQTGLFHEINPSSVNTIRVVTVKHPDGRISVENVFARFGHAGAVVDNVSHGGCEFYVDHLTGIIGPGKGKDGSCFTVHPETGHAISGLRIPHYEEALQLCRDAHQHAPEGLRFVGWDICISDDVLSIVEVNATPGFSSAPDGNFRHWQIMEDLLEEYTRSEKSVIEAPAIATLKSIS